jgi:hypothetical protein
MEGGVFTCPSTSRAAMGPILSGPSVVAGQVEVNNVSPTFPGPSHDFQVQSERTPYPSVSVGSSSLNIPLFGKLPQPMEMLVRDIPVVNGLGIEPLLQFL